MKHVTLFYSDVTHIFKINELRIVNRLYNQPIVFAKVYDNAEQKGEPKWYKIKNGKVSRLKSPKL